MPASKDKIVSRDLEATVSMESSDVASPGIIGFTLLPILHVSCRCESSHKWKMFLKEMNKMSLIIV
jgi:hypothetical protein